MPKLSRTAILIAQFAIASLWTGTLYAVLTFALPHGITHLALPAACVASAGMEAVLVNVEAVATAFNRRLRTPVGQLAAGLLWVAVAWVLSPPVFANQVAALILLNITVTIGKMMIWPEHGRA